MYDDAIKQFEAVVDKFPRGNKVHDSRYMLGVSYYRKGETSQAIDVLESALKRHPPDRSAWQDHGSAQGNSVT